MGGLELTPSAYIKPIWITTMVVYDPQITSYVVQRLGQTG
jgi:hypothetical protein